MITTSLVLRFLRKHWTAVAIGVILVVQSLSLYIYANKLEATQLKLEGVKAELVAETAKHKANLITLEAAIAKQNAAAKKLAEQAKAESTKSAKRAERVLQKPLPAPVGPGAESMNRWLESL